MNVTDLGGLDSRIFSGVNLFWGDLTLFITLTMFILKAIHHDPWRWRQNMAVRGAIGTAVYCLGMLFVRGWSVPLLVLTKHGYPTIDLENAYPVSLIGTMIAMVGMYCMVRVFSPVRWSFWGWLIPVTLAVVTGTLTVIFA